MKRALLGLQSSEHHGIWRSVTVSISVRYGKPARQQRPSKGRRLPAPLCCACVEVELRSVSSALYGRRLARRPFQSGCLMPCASFCSRTSECLRDQRAAALLQPGAARMSVRAPLPPRPLPDASSIESATVNICAIALLNNVDKMTSEEGFLLNNIDENKNNLQIWTTVRHHHHSMRTFPSRISGTNHNSGFLCPCIIKDKCF